MHNLFTHGLSADEIVAALRGTLNDLKQRDGSNLLSLTRVGAATGTIQVSAVTFPLMSIDPHAAQERFGMSPMQLRVATLLASRLTNAEIAVALDMATGTARKHVEWVFARTGAHAREEVVYLLADCLDDTSNVAGRIRPL